MLTYFPKYYSTRSIVAFVFTIIIVTILFGSHSLPTEILFFPVVSVLAFFYFSNKYSVKYQASSEKYFLKKLFLTALVIRVAYVVFIYFYNLRYFGLTYASEADIEFYIDTGMLGATRISEFQLGKYINELLDFGIDIGDMGYPLYLSFVYFLTGQISDVMIPFILKALMGTFTCLYIYQIGKRHFGDKVSRLAVIFCVFNPSMIWWCGSMMKETEMIFLTTAFINCWDDLILLGNKSKSNILVTIILSISLFSFRVALGIVALLSVVLTLILSTTKIKNKGKIFVIVVFFSLLMIIGFYDTMSAVVNQIYDEVVINDNKAQQANMEWRSTRVGGNEFAKYAGAVVFAPLIFTIPFPTLVYIDSSNEFLAQIAGGNFVKNILSFFVILSVFHLLVKKKWKEHILPLSFMCGYLVMLVLSVYAQSGRFHMPIIPFEMLFAAYGITLINKKNYHWFNYVIIFEILVNIAWNWFKLAGRGMV